MNEENVEKVISDYQRRQRARRNEELLRRLERGLGFEELLAELTMCAPRIRERELADAL